MRVRPAGSNIGDPLQVARELTLLQRGDASQTDPVSIRDTRKDARADAAMRGVLGCPGERPVRDRLPSPLLIGNRLLRRESAPIAYHTQAQEEGDPEQNN